MPIPCPPQDGGSPFSPPSADVSGSIAEELAFDLVVVATPLTRDKSAILLEGGLPPPPQANRK